jgi:hypothetical protein
MARTAEETAQKLTEIYSEDFGSYYYEPFKISWPQLRFLAGVSRVDADFLKKISDALLEADNYLIPFNSFLLFASEEQLSHFRTVPDRLLEQYLPDENNTGETEDVEVGNEN